jgi:hypothetical protein
VKKKNAGFQNAMGNKGEVPASPFLACTFSARLDGHFDPLQKNKKKESGNDEREGEDGTGYEVRMERQRVWTMWLRDK